MAGAGKSGSDGCASGGVPQGMVAAAIPDPRTCVEKCNHCPCQSTRLPKQCSSTPRCSSKHTWAGRCTHRWVLARVEGAAAHGALRGRPWDLLPDTGWV